MEDFKKKQLLVFFHTITKYYGCITEITSGIYSRSDYFDAKNTTWNLSEFTLIRSAFRHDGKRFIIEGNKMYYEFSAIDIIDFKHTKEHSYEIIEAYVGVTFRITKIKFYIK